MTGVTVKTVPASDKVPFVALKVTDTGAAPASASTITNAVPFAVEKVKTVS